MMNFNSNFVFLVNFAFGGVRAGGEKSLVIRM